MQIEAGKYYRTRDGQKVGPIECTGSINTLNGWPFRSRGVYFSGDGKAEGGKDGDVLPHMDIIAEWTDTPAAPKNWVDMTDAEKGELLLAKHEGKVIEICFDGKWFACSRPGWVYDGSYRVKPEPAIENVTMPAWVDNNGCLYSGMEAETPVTITFTRIDGKIDIASYRLTPREVAK